MNMSTPIAEGLKFTDFIMSLVTSDLSNEDAVKRALGDQGASISWVVGHLLHYRYLIMELLGADVSSPTAEQFGNEPASDGGGYPDIAELRKMWKEVSSRAQEIVATASDEQIMAPLGGPDAPHGEKKVLDTLVFYMWHESYHMGQLGTIRKQLGYKATAELAVEASS